MLISMCMPSQRKIKKYDLLWIMTFSTSTKLISLFDINFQFFMYKISIRRLFIHLKEKNKKTKNSEFLYVVTASVLLYDFNERR